MHKNWCAKITYPSTNATIYSDEWETSPRLLIDAQNPVHPSQPVKISGSREAFWVIVIREEQGCLVGLVNNHLHREHAYHIDDYVKFASSNVLAVFPFDPEECKEYLCRVQQLGKHVRVCRDCNLSIHDYCTGKRAHLLCTDHTQRKENKSLF